MNHLTVSVFSEGRIIQMHVQADPLGQSSLKDIHAEVKSLSVPHPSKNSEVHGQARQHVSGHSSKMQHLGHLMNVSVHAQAYFQQVGPGYVHTRDSTFMHGLINS